MRLKVNAAAAALAGSQDPTPGHPSHGDGEDGGRIEPRLVDLDDGNTVRRGIHNASSAVSRDTGARGPSALGPDSAATLLQSSFRGYRLRRGGGGVGGFDEGRNTSPGTRDREDDNEAGDGTSCTAADSGYKGPSVLEVEVRLLD